MGELGTLFCYFSSLNFEWVGFNRIIKKEHICPLESGVWPLPWEICKTTLNGLGDSWELESQWDALVLDSQSKNVLSVSFAYEGNRNRRQLIRVMLYSVQQDDRERRELRWLVVCGGVSWRSRSKGRLTGWMSLPRSFVAISTQQRISDVPTKMPKSTNVHTPNIAWQLHPSCQTKLSS